MSPVEQIGIGRHARARCAMDGKSMPARYDLIGRQYSAGRKSDPRIETFIHAELKSAGSVLNVGAGTGSYEPVQLSGISIEPSTIMIR